MKELRRQYEGNMDGIWREYKGVLRKHEEKSGQYGEIQRNYEGNVKGIWREHEGDMNEIWRMYEGNVQRKRYEHEGDVQEYLQLFSNNPPIGNFPPFPSLRSKEGYCSICARCNPPTLFQWAPLGAAGHSFMILWRNLNSNGSSQARSGLAGSERVVKTRGGYCARKWSNNPPALPIRPGKHCIFIQGGLLLANLW